jgi:hypothetical protein
MQHGDPQGLPYATAGSLPGATGTSAFSPRVAFSLLLP